MQKPEDRLFKTIPVQGRNTGKNALGYDFEYNTWSQVPTVRYTAAHPTKATGTTMPRSRLGSMRRAIEFNVFGGFAKYVQGQLEGTGPQMSPEDFIATITLGDKKYQKNPNAKNMTDVLSGNVKIHCELLNTEMQHHFKIYNIPNDSNERYDISVNGFNFVPKQVLVPDAPNGRIIEVKNE